MNRRTALKAIAALPMVPAVTNESPILYAHVHETPWFRGRVRITVNGQELKGCIWADVKKGCAEAFILDANGRKRQRNGEPLKHVLHGDVRIERIR